MPEVPTTPLRSGRYDSILKYRLVKKDKDHFILCPTHSALLLAIIFFIISIGLVMAPFYLNQQVNNLCKVLSMLSGITGLLFLVIDYFIQRNKTKYTFDTSEQKVTASKNNTIVTTFDLTSSVAIQICVSDQQHDIGSEGGTHHYRLYELNLVMELQKSISRENLFSLPNRSHVLSVGKRISNILNIPLLNHATREHIKLNKKIIHRTSGSTLRWKRRLNYLYAMCTESHPERWNIKTKGERWNVHFSLWFWWQA